MPDEKKPAGGPVFVSRVVTDPKNPPDVMILGGYRGASSEADHTRIYFTADLSQYADVPTADVLASQDVGDALGAELYWVKKDSKIVPSKAKTAALAPFGPSPAPTPPPISPAAQANLTPISPLSAVTPISSAAQSFPFPPSPMSISPVTAATRFASFPTETPYMPGAGAGMAWQGFTVGSLPPAVPGLAQANPTPISPLSGLTPISPATAPWTHMAQTAGPMASFAAATQLAPFTAASWPTMPISPASIPTIPTVPTISPITPVGMHPALSPVLFQAVPVAAGAAPQGFAVNLTPPSVISPAPQTTMQPAPSVPTVSPAAGSLPPGFTVNPGGMTR